MTREKLNASQRAKAKAEAARALGRTAEDLINRNGPDATVDLAPQLPGLFTTYGVRFDSSALSKAGKYPIPASSLVGHNRQTLETQLRDFSGDIRNKYRYTREG